MEDRLHFDIHKLKNGITVYSHQMDVPFFNVSVIIPYGSAHAIPENPGGVPGIAHFLEHVVLNRSKLYPEKDAFHQQLSLKGGYVNASTSLWRTNIYGNAPVTVQDDFVNGLFSHVWTPILDNEEDLAIERTIVANERNQRKYFPSSSELGKYLNTEWIKDSPVSKQQVFGTDEDLNAMTPEMLEKFHELYFSNQTKVVVGGGHNLEPILKQLELVETKDTQPKMHMEEISWAHKNYHQRSFKDLDTPTYYRGGFIPSYDLETSYALGFILGLLINHVHGPLHEWMRKEKGWTYGVSYGFWDSPDDISWRIKIPLNQQEPLEEIRAQLDERIRKAISDEKLISLEVERRLFNDIYAYQTLDDRMGQALYSLLTNGRILTEKEYQEFNGKMKDMKLLNEIYEKYMRPEVVGEFLALPEES